MLSRPALSAKVDFDLNVKTSLNAPNPKEERMALDYQYSAILGTVITLLMDFE
jgi:hypothetical protein